MKIKEAAIEYEDKLPYGARLCRISHARPHYHAKDLELVFCLEGAVELVAGHQKVRLQAGEVFSIDYRDIHYLSSDTENLTLIFHLDLTSLSEPWETLENIFFACESQHCYPYQQKAMEQVKDRLLSLSYVLFSKEISEVNEAAARIVDELMECLCKYFNWYTYESQDEYVNPEAYQRFYRILAYCGEHYNEKVTVSQLAEIEHINENYFSQFLQKTVFMSFSSMLKFSRCYEAERLLLNTELPISEISYSCGFSDPKYFYAAFKEWWGRTPAEHRRRYRAYMEKPDSVEIIAAPEAAALIKQHITCWHLEKTFGSSAGKQKIPT